MGREREAREDIHTLPVEVGHFAVGPVRRAATQNETKSRESQYLRKTRAATFCVGSVARERD